MNVFSLNNIQNKSIKKVVTGFVLLFWPLLQFARVQNVNQNDKFELAWKEQKKRNHWNEEAPKNKSSGPIRNARSEPVFKKTSTKPMLRAYTFNQQRALFCNLI